MARAIDKRYIVDGGFNMTRWLCLLFLVIGVGCGESADSSDNNDSSESENETQSTDPVETWGVTQQCEFLGGMYGCDGDFAPWDSFMTSCEASIPESCSVEDQLLISELFTCLQAAGAEQSCSDDDYATCESTHSLSGLSASCGEVIALSAG